MKLTKREKEIIDYCLHHFIFDGWGLDLRADAIMSSTELHRFLRSEKGAKFIEKKFPYLSIKNEKLKKAFKNEDEIKPKHLAYYYKQQYLEELEYCRQIRNKIEELYEL